MKVRGRMVSILLVLGLVFATIFSLGTARVWADAPKTVRVTFDAANGEAPRTVVGQYDATKVSEYAEAGGNIQKPADPKKADNGRGVSYRFLGWFAGNTEYYQRDAVQIFTKDLTLKAKYTEYLAEGWRLKIVDSSDGKLKFVMDHNTPINQIISHYGRNSRVEFLRDGDMQAGSGVANAGRSDEGAQTRGDAGSSKDGSNGLGNMAGTAEAAKSHGSASVNGGQRAAKGQEGGLASGGIKAQGEEEADVDGSAKAMRGGLAGTGEPTEVSDETELRSAFSAGGSIKLINSITLGDGVEVDKTVTLDLNGHTITNASSGFTKDYLIAVKYGGQLTVTDTSEGKNGAITTWTEAVYCGIKMTVKGDTYTDANYAELTVTEGTIQGYYYGISGNGKRSHTRITINGGTVHGYYSNDSTGIYQPQGDSTLTINGGTISGATGVEVRSGTLSVSGGTITGTGSHYSYTPNTNGTTTLGAGIAIAQHTTKNAISVTLTGGTVTGKKAVSVVDAQNNDMGNVAIGVNKSFAQSSTTILPEGWIWLQDGNGTCSPHKHTFGAEPTWRWTRLDDNWTAASTYTCTEPLCGEKEHVTATVSQSSATAGTVTYTATDEKGATATRTDSTTYTVTYGGDSFSYKWGEVATFSADGIRQWKIQKQGENTERVVADGVQTFSFAVTDNCAVTAVVSSFTEKQEIISTSLTSTQTGTAVFNAKWSLPLGAKVKEAIIYRGNSKNQNVEVMASNLMERGLAYDTGLKAADGDFTLTLTGLTTGYYQHVIIKIEYSLPGDTHHRILISGTKTGNDTKADKVQIT